MRLLLTGNKKKSFIVYSTKPHNVGEDVEVYEVGDLVQKGKIVKDMSTVSKYQNSKKQVDGKDVYFNSGKGYYQVEME